MLKYLLFLSIFFTGCYSEKKASKQLNKVSIEYPVLISQKCGELFKPIVTKDTQIVTEYINRIDTFLSNSTETIIVNDTIKKDCSKSVKDLALKLQNANRFIHVLQSDLVKNPPYIVKNIIDTSKVFSLTKERDNALKDKEDYRTRTEVMNKVCIWLLIIIIVLISYNYVNETKSKLYKSN